MSSDMNFIERFYVIKCAKVINYLWPTLALLLTLIWLNRKQYNQVVDGCDPFGYARQAQLFREKGYIEGLNTQFLNQEAKDLIDIGQSLSSNIELWGELIAPPCHHFNNLTQGIILQYPPGTGLILSFFSDDVAVANAYLLLSIIATLPFIHMCLTRNLSTLIKIISLISATIITYVASRQESFGSTSVPITILLIPITIYILIKALKSCSDAEGKGLFLVFGMLCGILYDIRVASLILLPAFFFAIAYRFKLLKLQSYNLCYKRALSIVTGFFLAASVTLWANKINAGGFLTSTYAKEDASLPILEPEIIYKNLHYYFFDSYGSFILIISCVLIVIFPLISSEEKFKLRDNEMYIGAILCLFSSLAFFSTHKVIGTYYMIPTSVTVLCMSVMQMGCNSPAIIINKPRKIIIYNIIFFMLFSFSCVRFFLFDHYKPYISLPEEVIKSKSIIWSETVAGTAVYYFNKYAGKFYQSNEQIQDAIISSVSMKGYRQFLIPDSGRLEKILMHIMSYSKVKEIGAFQSFYYNFPIWEINSNDPDALINSSNQYTITENNHIFSEQEIKNIKLSDGSIEEKDEFKLISFDLENENHISIPAHSSIGAPFRITWQLINPNENTKNNWVNRKDIFFDINPKVKRKIKIFIPKSELNSKSTILLSFLQEGHLKAYEIGIMPLSLQLQ